MAETPRVRLFIDFWNFQLNWNAYHTRVGAGLMQIPWKVLLPSVLTSEALKGQPAKFSGAHVYASFNANNPKDRKLHGWLLHTLASFQGYVVDAKQRKPRKAIRCTNENCRETVSHCPKCQQALTGTVEKGIDASIITDLVTFAYADFAPAVQYIQKKTDKQIVHAFFKNSGDELKNACWDHIFLEDVMAKLLPDPGVATVIQASSAAIKKTPV